MYTVTVRVAREMEMFNAYSKKRSLSEPTQSEEGRMYQTYSGHIAKSRKVYVGR